MLELRWEPVSLDVDGQPLDSSQLPMMYRVYRCFSSSPNCNKSNATFVAAVPATQLSFNLLGQPSPSRFFVTADNAVESPASASVRFKA